MSSTVNTMTISLVNSDSSALVFICVMTLVILLVQKLLAASTNTRFAHTLNLALNAFLVPTMMAFILIAVMRVVDLLGQ